MSTLGRDLPLSAAAPEIGIRIRQVLDRAGYSEAHILERLGVARLPPFRLRGDALPLYRWRTREGTALDSLVRLFVLQQPIPLEAARHALAPMDPEEWLKVGLLRPVAEEVGAAFELCCYQGLVAAADWPGQAGAGLQPVMGIAASSRDLASMTVRRPASRTLDLGTGCGVLAFLAAAHSDQVVAVDCNPRATEMARFNARLNGISNIEFHNGDLFTPVRGSAFDLIVCNPPFIIAPGAGHRHTYSGQPGDQLCQAIVGAAPAFLREGGYCQVLCNWAVVTGQDWRDRLAGWVAGTGCDAWVLHSQTEDAASYALQRIRERADEPERSTGAFDELMAYYQQERIEAVGFGLITLRRSGRPAPWFRCDSLPALAGPCGPAIERGFILRDFLEANREDAAFLAARLRPAAKLRWDQEHEVSANGLSSVASRLRLAEGLCYFGEADANVVAWITRSAGDRSLADQVAELAVSTGQDLQTLVPAFLRVVRRLVELGFLVPL